MGEVSGQEPRLKAAARLIIASCLGLMAATGFLILAWLISGDLMIETVGAGLVLILVLGGLALLARRGRVHLATWLLLGLLLTLISLDAAAYGLESPAAAAYVLPVLLAACALGLWAGMAVALLGSAAVWLMAIAAQAGWYEPYSPFELSHLTFTAPFLTVILVLTALIVGSWNRSMDQQRIERSPHV